MAISAAIYEIQTSPQLSAPSCFIYFILKPDYVKRIFATLNGIWRGSLRYIFITDGGVCSTQKQMTWKRANTQVRPYNHYFVAGFGFSVLFSVLVSVLVSVLGGGGVAALFSFLAEFL
jgi:hypothetical protein